MPDTVPPALAERFSAYVGVTATLVYITALAGLSGEALCVAVSLRRARNVYPVFEERPVNIGESCHVPMLNLYSAPEMVFSVMLLDVTFAAVGAAGAAGVDLFTVMVKS